MKRTLGFLLMSLGLVTGTLWAQEEATPAGVSLLRDTVRSLFGSG